MPVLTHEKIQELTQTPKGKLISGTPFAAFPALLANMESALLQQLALYDRLKHAAADSDSRKMLLLEMLEDHLYLELAHYIQFIKWREQQVSKAS